MCLYLVRDTAAANAKVLHIIKPQRLSLIMQVLDVNNNISPTVTEPVLSI